MCKYSYRDENNVRQPIYCKVTKKQCIYSQYCNKVGKFIEKNGMENCFISMEEANRNIPKGAYYVRFSKKGYLYVEIDNKVVKILDTIGTVKNYVYLKDNNGEYEISLTPFASTIDATPKSTTSKKRNTKSKANA